MDNKQVSRILANAPYSMIDIDDCIDFLIAMSPTDEDPVFFSGTERDEYKAWLSDIRNMKPKMILEIGTYRGRTTWLLSRVCANDTVIITVELKPEAPWPDLGQMGLPGQQIISLVGDSRSEFTRRTVAHILGHRWLDLLFIDSSHNYDDTVKEVALYLPLVKKGGSIALHDMISDPDVGAIWKEIIEQHPIHKVYDCGQYGIGMAAV